MKTILVFLILLPLLSFGQNAQKDTDNKSDKGNLKLGNSDTLIIDKTQKAIYKTGGRRDPFISLLREFVSKNVKKALPPGLAGLMIEEIKLEGIYNFKGIFHASFIGPDNKSYLITKGERLYDGEVINIGIASVTFRKELTTRIEGKKERIIVIKLNPGDLSSQGGSRK